LELAQSQSLTQPIASRASFRMILKVFYNHLAEWNKVAV
jgi:hypothetical protein